MFNVFGQCILLEIIIHFGILWKMRIVVCVCGRGGGGGMN